MKKLLAFVVAGGLLALTTGCPPAPTSEPTTTTPGTTTHPGTTTTPGTTTHPGTTTAPGTTTTPPAGETKTVTGKVEKASKDSVTVEGKDYKVGADTKVTIDGKDDKAENLKKDQEVTLKVKGDTATEITAAKGANPPPPPPPPGPAAGGETKGKVTKIEGTKITVKPETGDAKTFDAADAKVTIDGADKKAADLKDVKTDDKTTATVTEKDGKVSAVDIKTK